MKKIYSILMILAAAAGFTNCAKTELVEPKEAGNGGTVVYATTDAATKTTLADDYKVLWSSGDQIKFVKNDDPAITYTFTLSSGEETTSGTFTCDGSQTPVDGTYTVYYPATYNGTNCPAQNYVNAADISGAPMKATATVSDGIVSDISFKNEGGILRYTVKGTKTIKSINVKSASPALDVTLDCGEGVALAAEGTVFNIALPAGEYSNATLSFTAKNNIVATKTASTFTVTKNKVSLATFDGLAYTLAGVFTVDNKGNDDPSDDVKVRFSGGNLYAKKESGVWKWHFYDEQYKFLAADMEISGSTGNPQRKVQSSETEIHLFTWGYDATKSIDPDGSGFVEDHTINGKSFDPAEDWGTQIGDGSTWRTLSTAEWQYLFNSRKDAAIKVGYATVCGVNGLIILPDNFTDPMKNNGSGAFVHKSSKGWDKNVYASGENWNAMETAGAVFLPAAGYRRSGSDVINVGLCGYYWSSSAYNGYNAYMVNYAGNDVIPSQMNGSGSGISVRLITECQ